MSKHRALSTKSLALVSEWCDANQGTPLAEAYEAACIAVGALDCNKIADQLKSTWVDERRDGGIDVGYVAEAFKPYHQSFVFRDTIGRVIFDLIKRESRRESDRKAKAGIAPA